MPLQSRANRTSAAVTTPAEPRAGVDLQTSPRRRVAAPVVEQEPPFDDAKTVGEEVQEEQEGQNGNQSEGLERREAPVDHEADSQTRIADAATEAVAKRVRKPRVARPRPELPDDFSQLLETDDPAELRAHLKLVEDAVRDKRKAFEEEMKVYRTLYKDITAKLVDTL